MTNLSNGNFDKYRKNSLGAGPTSEISLTITVDLISNRLTIATKPLQVPVAMLFGMLSDALHQVIVLWAQETKTLLIPRTCRWLIDMADLTIFSDPPKTEMEKPN